MTLNKYICETLNLKGVTVEKVEKDESENTLYIYIQLHKKHQGLCPHCHKKCPGYDIKTRQRKWRSLDSGVMKVFLVCDHHRIQCSEHGVVSEEVPWAFHTSSFTKKFEQEVAYKAVHNSKKNVCIEMRINWRTVGSIIARVQKAKEKDPAKKYEDLKVVGVDETSYRKGHTYLTTVVNHETGEVIWAHDGHGKGVFEAFFEDIGTFNAQSIRMISGDGARWIKDTAYSHAPQAEFCIDPYHVVTWALDAMDQMRRRIWREAYEAEKVLPKRKRGRPKKGEEPKGSQAKLIKHSKYSLGKNPEHLTDYQKSSLEQIRFTYPKLFKGYQLKESLRAIFHRSEGVEEALKKWLSWACRCRIPEFVELSKKIRRHRNSILSTMKYGISNARIEALNNKIKLIIRRSYGFGNVQNLIGMIMLVCSNIGRNLQPAYASDPDFD